MKYIASLIVYLVSFFSPLIRTIFFNLSFKTSGLTIFFGLAIAAYVSFLATITLIINNLQVAMPQMAVNVWSWVMPSNFYTVAYAIVTVQIYKYGYERYQIMISTASKVISSS